MSSEFMCQKLNLTYLLHLVPHMNCVGIVSDNGLSLIRRQAIILPNAGLLSIAPSGTKYSEIWNKMQNVTVTKMHLKISSAKWRPFFPGGDELTT